MVSALMVSALSSSAEPEFDLDEVLQAVVAVDSVIPGNARTANSLGTERAGSGVVIGADGLIVTIGYLILEASSATVTFADGSKEPVEIVAYDHNTGFGLLRPVRPVALDPLPLGDSSAVRASDPVLVVSHGGVAGAMPAMVESRRTFAGYWEYLLDDAIFTAPPHPRFGGAALIGVQGRLLGIGSLVVGDARVADEPVPGNMFVPIDEIKPILEALVEEGRSPLPSRPWLGLYIQEVRGHLLVTRVADDGPAAKAGLEGGEIVLGVNGDEVESLADFYRKVWADRTPGDTVSLVVARRSGLDTLTIESADRYQWLRFARGL
jgi:S1-C subfamily serine protease